ncbi:MAG TPA: KGK domain-containing protein [Kamptonema sp.]|nr:KGK domain-containing protein [Kamptonema sp.]
MEPQTETNNQFKPLDCDDDILLIQKDTFTVGRFKEIASQKLHTRFFRFKCLEENQDEGRGVLNIMDHLHSRLSLGELQIPIVDSKWIFPREGIDCQLLNIGSQGWQKGRLRIEASIDNKDYRNPKIYLSLEFCLD